MLVSGRVFFVVTNNKNKKMPNVGNLGRHSACCQRFLLGRWVFTRKWEGSGQWNFLELESDLSNEDNNPGCLGMAWGVKKLPFVMGFIISHYRNPYQTARISMESLI